MKKQRMTRQDLTQVISCIVLGISIITMVVLPTGFVVQRPGPTVNVIDEGAPVPAITVSGVEDYPPEGSLFLTTVQVQGGEGYPTWAFDILSSYFRADSAVTPVENVFPKDLTREEINERTFEEMDASQRRAVVVALESLGYDIPTVLRIVGTVPDTGADGVLEADDVLLGINGTRVANFAELDAELDDVAAGDTAVVDVERDGETLELEVDTTASEDDEAQLGVLLDPDFELPIEVDINAQEIGGPSAGLIFALGIVDLLTPGSLTGGAAIAGTGTIDLAGSVGTIGGIQQKLYGAAEGGAAWFLAPTGNCNDFATVPDGLTVIPVDDFKAAKLAVEAIAAGQGAALPMCDAVSD